MFLQTAQARAETSDSKRSKYLIVLFDTVSQVFFITPRANILLNWVAKGGKQFSIKSFGKNEMKQELENVDIVIKTLSHKKILLNTFVSDISLPINSQKLNFCMKNTDIYLLWTLWAVIQKIKCST